MTRRPLAWLAAQLSDQLEAGYELAPSLRRLRQSMPPGWQRTLASVADDTEAGMRLSESMARNPRRFGPAAVRIVEGGEYAGAVGPSLSQLAETASLRRANLRWIWTVLALVWCGSVLGVLAFGVIPEFEEMFSDIGADLPRLTVLVLTLSEWFRAVAIWGPIGLVLWLACKTPPMAPLVGTALDHTLAQVPVLGRSRAMRAHGVFLGLLGRLLGAGVEPSVAIEAARHAGGPGVPGDHLSLLQHVAAGREPLTDALLRLRWFDLDMAGDLVVGDASGDVGGALQEVGRACAERVNTHRRLVATPLPALCIVGGIVAIAVSALGLVLPLFALVEMLG